MAKLIPGKVRSQGAFSMKMGSFPSGSKGKVPVFSGGRKACVTVWMMMPFLQICAFQRKFCTHLAAIEAYLKNDDSGKCSCKSLEEDATATEETQEKVSFGSLFLDQVLPKIEKKETLYILSSCWT